MPPVTKANNFNGTEPDARIGEAGLTLKTELRSIDASCQHVMPAERKGTFKTTAHSNSDGECEMHHRHWEFAEGHATCVKFSLKSNIVFWEEHLKPSPFVLNVLRYGYPSTPTFPY